MSYYIYQTDGSNRSEAEKRTLEFLELDKKDIEFELLSEKKGLMSLFKGSPSVLIAYPAHENISIRAHAKGVISMLVEKMNVKASIKQIGDRDDNLYIELTSEDTGFLIGKHGRILDSLQFLVNLIVHTNCKDSQRIMLDVDGYRDRREKNLLQLADRMADRADKTGASVLLNYMNPYERRIVHMHLEQNDKVKTESEGNGVYKRLRVIPLRKKEGRKKDSNSRYSAKKPAGNNEELYDESTADLQNTDDQKLYEDEHVVENIVDGTE